jgi:hypothetical protein
MLFLRFARNMALGDILFVVGAAYRNPCARNDIAVWCLLHNSQHQNQGMPGNGLTPLWVGYN